MPRRKVSRYGPGVYQAGTHANAYEQWMEYPDGTPVHVVTIKVGEEPDATYIDMEAEVAERLLADLPTAVGNARHGLRRFGALAAVDVDTHIRRR